MSLQLGPFAIPLSLLITLAAIALGWFVGLRLGRRAGLDTDPLLLRMLIVGLLGARLGFISEWSEPYLASPWSMLDIRDGGWDAAIGVAAAALYGLYRARGEAGLRKPVIAAALSTALVWTIGTFGIALWPRDTVALPSFALPSLDGRSVALASFAGKPTVVNLWATWCPPCRREMPVLQRAQAAHPEVNIVFVNQGETPQAVAAYLGAQTLPLHNVLIDAGLQTGRVLGQRGLPATLFFDADGRLVDTRIGELSEATLAQRLSALRPHTPAALR